MIKKKWYSWLTDLYKKIIKSKLIFSKNCNLIINYSCNLGIDLLVFSIVKWIFCLNKNKYNFCNKCLQCNLVNINNHPNFFFILNKKGNEINISSIKIINDKLLNNLFINKFKIVYLSNYNFFNNFVNNFLLNLMEGYYNNIIFIISCFDYFNIPTTILSRCHKYKLLFPLENDVYNWIINCKKINLKKKYIITAIRLSKNSPFSSILLLKKFWLFRLNLFKFLINLNINSIDYFVSKINISIFNMYIYWLLTLFIDLIKFKFKYFYYIYNLDSIKLIKYLNKKICINNNFFLLNKLIKYNNNIYSVINVNKEILLYNIFYRIYNFINLKK